MSNIQITTQRLQDPETKENFVGLFGRMTTKVINGEGVETDKDINFATRLDAVPGLERIINNMIKETEDLYREDIKTGKATFPLATDAKNVPTKKVPKKRTAKKAE